ncbi:MAG: hypothetical protein AB7V11_13985 [Pyrinomonadaceae bacterium]
MNIRSIPDGSETWQVVEPPATMRCRIIRVANGLWIWTPTTGKMLLSFETVE